MLHARPHSAALLGWGSDVLGFDTTVSTDHGWGPRMHVFVGPSDVDAVRRNLAAGLPEQFRVARAIRLGQHPHPTSASRSAHSPTGCTTTWASTADRHGPLDSLLPHNRPCSRPLTGRCTPTRRRLGRVRALLAWFPPQVHRWLLACQWERLTQEEAFVGRAAQPATTSVPD